MLLRSIVTSLTAALETQARQALTREKNLGLLPRSRNGNGAGSGGIASSGPLLSGLLLVGRLAWLLKIRGRFVEEALSPSLTGNTTGAGAGTGASATANQDHSNSGHHTAAVNNSNNSGLYISEDQMRSAFEIADTNGDGVLTYAEAIDAIQVTHPYPPYLNSPFSLNHSYLLSCISFYLISTSSKILNINNLIIVIGYYYSGPHCDRLYCGIHLLRLPQQQQ